MKIAIIGSGGREHTIAWKLNLCENVNEILIMPGNPGIDLTKGIRSLNIGVNDFEKILITVKNEGVDLVIIGPEGPLDNGIVNFLQANDIKVLGPDEIGAKMESSKAFSKAFMKKYDLPTAGYQVHTNYQEALTYLNSIDVSKGIVLKADELAGGKGVVVTKDYDEAAKTLYDFMENPNCSVKTKSILFEDLLIGDELSAFALYDGESFVNLGYARDYKRVFDNDEGPNTGGMGTFSNNEIVSDKMKQKINDKIFTPFLEGMKKEGTPFSGFLFAGLMIEDDQVDIIEFNVRFGDPETQVIFPRMKGNIADLFLASATSNLKNFKGEFSLINETAVHIVMCSEKYPSVDGTPMNLGNEIRINEEYFKNLTDSYVFYAGVKNNENGTLVNSSGRVLGVTSLANTKDEARTKAYEGIEHIKFSGAHFRNDIAK